MTNRPSGPRRTVGAIILIAALAGGASRETLVNFAKSALAGNVDMDVLFDLIPFVAGGLTLAWGTVISVCKWVKAFVGKK